MLTIHTHTPFPISFYPLRTSLCEYQTSWEIKIFNPPQILHALRHLGCTKIPFLKVTALLFHGNLSIAADKLRFILSSSQCLRAFYQGFTLFFIVLLENAQKSADIYEKYPFLVFFEATDGNFTEKYSVTPSWERTCLWQMTSVRIVSCRSADFNIF